MLCLTCSYYYLLWIIGRKHGNRRYWKKKCSFFKKCRNSNFVSTIYRFLALFAPRCCNSWKKNQDKSISWKKKSQVLQKGQWPFKQHYFISYHDKKLWISDSEKYLIPLYFLLPEVMNDMNGGRYPRQYPSQKQIACLHLVIFGWEMKRSAFQ